ncbi:DsbA family oxidoreductase [Aurantiacibacter spongiae]|uniref:DsbA family oxidoreductase n=1 Tax=Aurantiacibacter spongiae TaxID=2488860 RepID=A0A3N5CVX7_9SPHN|nr:DsbA family oxidoreductase [Aurantiacibacter spongiae]RPF70799.1 DsbA family oxidoreductase [Aurantiacibacter spongiae]
MKTPVIIDIWSDVMCPWCVIGYRALIRGIEQGDLAIEPTIRWMPFELNPDTPPQGWSQADHVREVYGRGPDDLERMRGEIAEVARQLGFPMDYAGKGEAPEPMMRNSFAAHCLLRHALRTGGPDAQTRLAEALFAAHFQQRLDVADTSVLLDIAQDAGIERTEAAAALEDETLAATVRAEEEKGRNSGITAVPTFIVNGKYVVQGAQAPAAYAEALRQVVDLETGDTTC